jgi:hypothetical protein
VPHAARPLLDAIVQSTTVDLFHSRGVAVAPLPSSTSKPLQATYFALAGVVNFNAPNANGSLSLSWADPVFSLFTPPVVANGHGSRDLLRELTNQLIGRVKNRLLHFQLFLKIGVPSVISGQALERQRQRRELEIVYLFRTLRGEIVVTLDASIEAGALSYSSAVRVAKEGEFIPF